MIQLLKSGRRIVCILFAALCILLLALPAAAAEESTESGFSYTSVVRYGPYSGSAVIGQLEDGTELKVLGTTRDYYKIDCYEMNGYISKKQVAQDEDGTFYVNCNPGSRDTKVLPTVSMADTLQLRSSILELADQQVGTPYVYGGTRPGGFDCSGFSSYLYRQQGYKLWRCADDQMQDGVIVPRDSLQAGDLVFFKAYGPWLASHVGVYVGDNMMIHAGSSGIQYTSLDVRYFANSYVGARRIVNVDTAAAQEVSSLTELSPMMARSTVGIRTAN